MRRARGTVTLCAVLLTTIATPAMAIEEPAYRIVQTIDDIEVRDYAAYTVAEVEVAGPADEAGGQAFPILAGYIFGKNAGERRLPMTAPVVQTPAPVRMAMTAPVIQNGTVVQFVLPDGVTRATAPEPLDARVHVRDVPARRYAVIRYSGLWSKANDGEHLTRLRSVIAGTALRVIGEPSIARYDAPFKPWFMRRNEIWLPVATP